MDPVRLEAVRRGAARALIALQAAARGMKPV